MQPDIFVLRHTRLLSKAAHLAHSCPAVAPIFASGDTPLLYLNNKKSYKNHICVTLSNIQSTFVNIFLFDLHNNILSLE